ncbi:transmembrane protein 127-like [Zootermopsis nevadensis]|uniref:Transmembrane protein 127 transmembrane region domain-containing protein n=1 Tax=Zootermopsis nevadensis TaxID=136037 RepID=A0A067RF82_ZOONE|nr:transmembrane protein 127-like [Zootermopsis nevadensis]XP_021921310.1 transmembrane protein 127-like [Zootermopsis nevadensis]XP_021921312.1 transmembrane protein 127-like [Zootermopsis nevadensis]KDR18783.1 hypothetical protein L798_06463 [Zootermopsis nevadensis]
MMYNPTYYPRQRWHVPKEQERNFVAAFFHMATIALTCTSLAQLGWFHLKGGQCTTHLAVYQFFSFGYFDTGARQTDLQFRAREVVSSPMSIQYHSPSGTLRCVTPEIADLMHVIIILCFMAMISSLVGFFLDIVGPTKKFMKVIQRNSIPSIFTVLWVVAIIGVCYDITRLLEVSGIKVYYEYGCYTITAAGAVAVCATASNLLQNHSPIEDIHRRRLMDDWDGVETFSVMGGSLRSLDTPLESIPPPPPYSP